MYSPAAERVQGWSVVAVARVERQCRRPGDTESVVGVLAATEWESAETAAVARGLRRRGRCMGRPDGSDHALDPTPGSSAQHWYALSSAPIRASTGPSIGAGSRRHHVPCRRFPCRTLVWLTLSLPRHTNSATSLPDRLPDKNNRRSLPNSEIAVGGIASFAGYRTPVRVLTVISAGRSSPRARRARGPACHAIGRVVSWPADRCR